MVSTIIVSPAVKEALTSLQEAVTRRESALNISKKANDRVVSQRIALEIRQGERAIAELELDAAQIAVETAQADLVRALGGRAFDPNTGNLT